MDKYSTSIREGIKIKYSLTYLHHFLNRCKNGNRDTCEFESDLEGICEGLNFNFIAHPNDCGLAIFCFEGTPIVRECPKGEIFDARAER